MFVRSGRRVRRPISAMPGVFQLSVDELLREAHAVADAGEAAVVVPELLAPGDVVLVKASRGMGLELVCRALGAGEDPA